MFAIRRTRSFVSLFVFCAFLFSFRPLSAGEPANITDPGSIEQAGVSCLFGNPIRVRLPLVRQSTGYTCGVSAVQSVFGYYGDDIRNDKLARLLKADPDQGTSYLMIQKVATKRGYRVRVHFDMTLDELKDLMDRKKPTILSIQAWPGHHVDWPSDWEDGHYVVAVGYDGKNFYFMDPATLGDFTYIPISEFLDRWHDKDQKGNILNHFGIVIDGKQPAYNPWDIKRLR